MPKEKSFTELVFVKTTLIPRGKVSTYKLVTNAIGHPQAARAVGNALNKNCDPKVPCHRVVRSDGAVGGFRDGATAKIKILRKEGVEIVKGKVLLEKYLYVLITKEFQ